MPRTGFHLPNSTDSPEYILEYIEYKRKKMKILMNQSKKLLSHVVRARKILGIIVDSKNE